MTYMVMAYIVVVYIVMAYIAMAYVAMAYIAIVLTSGSISSPYQPRLYRLRIGIAYIVSVSASPTAGPLRGYGPADTQTDRLGESIPTPCGTSPWHAYARV